MNKKILLFATLFSVFSGQFVEAGKKDGKKDGKKTGKKADKKRKNRQGNQPGYGQAFDDDAILEEAAAAAAAEAAASSASASAGTGSRRVDYPSAAAAAVASRQIGYFGGSNGGGRDEEAAASSAASVHRKLTDERIKSIFLSDPDIHVQGILNKKIKQIDTILEGFLASENLYNKLADIYQTKTTIHKEIEKIQNDIVDIIRAIAAFVINKSDTFSMLLKKQAKDFVLIIQNFSSNDKSKLEFDLSMVGTNILIRLQDPIFNQIDVKNTLKDLNLALHKQIYETLPELLAKLDDLYRELQGYAESVFRDFEPIIQAKQKAESATVRGQGYPSAAAAAAASAAQQAAQKESRSSGSASSGGGCDEDALGKKFNENFQRAIRKNQAKQQKAESARKSSANSISTGYPSAAAAAAASAAQQVAQKESRSSGSQSGGGCDEDALGEDFKKEFQRAICKNNVAAIDQCCFQLRARGNNVNTFSIFNNDCNALFFAVSQGKVGAIKHLIENCGADVMAHNNKGNNILHYAAAYQGHSWNEIMEYLFENKDRRNNLRRPDFINKVNNKGKTPLDCVCATVDDKTDREKSLLSLGAKSAEDNAAAASTGVSDGGGAAVVAQATQPTTICEIALRNDGPPIPLNASERCSLVFFVEQDGILSESINAAIFITNEHTKEKNLSVFDLELNLQNQAGQRIFLLIRKPDGAYPQGLVLDITEHLLDIENEKAPSFSFLRQGNNSYAWSFGDSVKTQGIRKTTEGRWAIIPK